MKPPKTISMDALIEQLDTLDPNLEWETDRHWIWVTTNLAPIHAGKCACQDCTAQAEKRKALLGLGFIYARKGHTCPSGAVAYWGNHCERPTKFRRRSGEKKEQPAPEQAIDVNSLSDQELLAMLG